MTNKIKIFACFALCFLFVSQAQAQSYLFPGPERVEALLEMIDGCKEGIAGLEKNLKFMEDNPSSFTLQDYLNAKKMIETGKVCLKNARAALDKLRKDYPGWFNQPEVVMPLSKGHEISPAQLEKLLADMEAALVDILKRMENIQKPR